MTSAITEGLALMPLPFSAGLTNWANGDGTPGSASYATTGSAALVPSDQDFGGCLELVKTDAVQKLRYMTETPFRAGLYLRIKVRLKVMSGAFPSARIAAWAGSGPSTPVASIPLTGPDTALTQYGQIVTLETIYATGNRAGVNVQWPSSVTNVHFGLDLTGANGGVVRIDDIEIEDVTSFWVVTKLASVDVRDFGAAGNGTTDDYAAFVAADAAAAGRDLLVPAGNFFINDNLTINAPVRFEGKITMAATKRLILRQNFDLPSYIRAFGGDETEGFKRAFQALLNFSDHDSLDMKGRRIDVTAPIDMRATDGIISNLEIRRVLRNGMFNVVDGPAWAPTIVTSNASYSASNPNQLTNVVNVSAIQAGSLITGIGVGREVYVTSVNIGASTVNLSSPLYGPNASQTYTFTRYKYVLDFSGFNKLSKFVLSEVEIQCNGFANCVLLPPAGEVNLIRGCMFNRPKHRAITSHGFGCQGLQIDNCQFNSNETAISAPARVSIAFNSNGNDVKVRDSRFARFRHTGVMSGRGNIITSNHWFQGDDDAAGPRLGGIILTSGNARTVFTGNYIDNATIELTNEHSEAPDFTSGFSFGAVTITGNTFTSSDAASYFTWIVVKPYGSDNFLQGFHVVGNVFRTISGTVTRIDSVDTSLATLDNGRMRNVTFDSNTFNGVTQTTQSPVTLEFNQASNAATWTLDFSAYLPFNGWARTVPNVTTEGAITNGSNASVYAMPYVTPNFSANGNQVRLTWPEAVKGRVQVTARVDNPV